MASLLAANYRVSRRIDAVARGLGRRDGNWAFLTDVLPGLLRPGARILDVGGGKNPAISVETKQRLGLKIDGLDVSREELERAPAGAYDGVVVGDVSSVSIGERYDLVFSCAVMEHVRDTPRAVSNLAAALKPGATMAHFVPNAFAPFALTNRLLGTDRARRVLFGAFPKSKLLQGFEAFYRECWPTRFAQLCRDNGLDVVSVEPYFSSGYCSFFFPLHAVDVSRQVALMRLGATNLCESFTLIARRPG